MSKLVRLLISLLALALVAVACGGEAEDADGDDVDATADVETDDGDADSGSDDDADAGDADADDGDADDGADTDGDEPAASGDNFGQGTGELWDDQRDPLFADFQASFDRTHPFQGLDQFCFPTTTDEELVAADHPGITEESITIVHLRQRLEQLEAIGFAVDIGDPIEQYDRFIDYVNTECGGIYGRTIDLRLVEVDAFNPSADIDALRNTACIQATEDENSVITINGTGFGGSASLCLTDGDNIFISTQGQPDEFVQEADGKLISLNHTNEDSLRYMIEPLIANGSLDGATVGLVGDDTPGRQDVTDSVVTLLEDAGINVAVVGTAECNGSTSCVGGIIDIVTEMVDAEVDVVFPMLSVTSLAPFVVEMSTQGYEPGDVQFYNSPFQSQGGDLVSSKVVAFGGEAAGALYDGTLIVDQAWTGDFRADGYEPTPFQTMCHETFQAAGGAVVDPLDTTNSEFGSISSTCVMVRMAMRAIFDAGPNPTFEDINNAMQNLGPVDNNPGIPASIVPGKPTLPDAVHTMEFQYPCRDELPGFDPDTAGSCIQSIGEPWVAVG